MTRAIAPATTRGLAKRRAAEAGGASPRNRVRFGIGKITFHGYGAGEQKRFVASLQETLTTLAHRNSGLNWLAMADVTVSRLDTIELPSGASPEQAAQFVARKLFVALKRSGSSTNV
jgi:hypothetical protein